MPSGVYQEIVGENGENNGDHMIDQGIGDHTIETLDTIYGPWQEFGDADEGEMTVQKPWQEIGDMDMDVEAQDLSDANLVAEAAAVPQVPVSDSGGCACPKCGVPLRLVIAPSGGKTISVTPKTSVKVKGYVEVVGADAPKQPAIQAGSCQCLCKCPGCGTMICLCVAAPTTVVGAVWREIVGYDLNGKEILGDQAEIDAKLAQKLAEEKEAERLLMEAERAEAARAQASKPKYPCASVSKSGMCKCPKCGASLRLKLLLEADGGAVKVPVRGNKFVNVIGHVEEDVLGALMSVKSPAIAKQAGQCLCLCPKCKATICLVSSAPVTSVAGDWKEIVGSGGDNVVGSFYHGLDVLGAHPPRKIPKWTKPKGKVTGKVTGKKGSMTGAGIKTAIANVNKAIDRAVKAGNLATGKGVAHKPGKTIVKGDYVGGTVLGAGKRNLTAKQSAAVDKFNVAIKRNNDAAKKAAERGKKAIDKAMKAKAAVEKTTKRVEELLKKQKGMAAIVKTGRGTTKVRGDDVLGAGRTYTGPETAMRDVPEDAVEYDGGAYGYPDGEFGSANYFEGGDGFNYHGEPAVPGWYPRINNEWKDAETGDIAARSNQVGWGPLISNPKGKIAGLKWSLNKQVWFWPKGTAPAWATAEADAVEALLVQQEEAANAAAAEAEAARIEKEEAEIAEAQYKQDAANALLADQAAKDEALAQQKQATADIATQAQLAANEALLEQQRMKAEMETQQAQMKADIAMRQQQAMMDAQMASLQMEQEKAALPLEMQQAQIDMKRQAMQDALEARNAMAAQKWAEANPDLAYGPQQGGGGENGGGYGGEEEIPETGDNTDYSNEAVESLVGLR